MIKININKSIETCYVGFIPLYQRYSENLVIPVKGTFNLFGHVQTVLLGLGNDIRKN